MTKKPKRDRSAMDELPPQTPVVVESPQPPGNIGSYLERVRNEALERHGHVDAEARAVVRGIERTIADLEAWRNEIDATIAFLKATRR